LLERLLLVRSPAPFSVFFCEPGKRRCGSGEVLDKPTHSGPKSRKDGQNIKAFFDLHEI